MTINPDTNNTTAGLTSVTARVTARDIENVEEIFRRTTAKSKAQALSIALSLTRYIIDRRDVGDDVWLRDRDGEISRVVMKELNL